MTIPSLAIGKAAALLQSVRRRISAPAVELAYHASLPVAIDPDLLHLVRVNFLPGLPYEAEARLLLSPLFEDLGDGLYEIRPELRNLLLTGLRDRFGWKRVRQIAILLEKYTDHVAVGHANPELEQAQRLTALGVLNPEAAERWLAAAATDAPSAPLGHPWFVAMRQHLASFSGQASATTLDNELRAAIDRLKRAHSSEKHSALRTVTALAALPGADASLAVNALSGDAHAPDRLIAQAIAVNMEATRPDADLGADAPAFFLSYARASDRRTESAPEIGTVDNPVERFYDDLCDHVRQLVGFRTGTLPGLVDLSMDAGFEWRSRLLYTLNNARVFVALLSPDYLDSPWCRTEWELFSRAHPERRAGAEPARHKAIVPVTWIPISQSPIPTAIQEVQLFTPDNRVAAEVRRDYLANGLYRQLVSGSPHYRTVVWHLARRISDLYHALEVSPDRALNPDQLRSAFVRKSP